MHKGLATLFIITLIFGSGYWYYTANAVCKVPVAYSIGSIDPRFDITTDEVRTAVSNAESLWEDATGRNLFTYDSDASFAINFVFDDRQERADAENDLRSELEEKQTVSTNVREEYERLQDEYEAIKTTYERKAAVYETRLSAYNEKVAYWNERGGAPPATYDALGDEQRALAREQDELSVIAQDINALAEDMNAVSEEGNSLVADYNRTVEEYNTRFHEHKEFTQGDYIGKAINIYQFDSLDELHIVLAHELGHALGIGHVPGETSVMYQTMEAQMWEEGLTRDDLDEFDRICGTERFTLWSIL